MKFTFILFLASLCLQNAFAKDVTLKWKNIEGAKKYNLEISENQDFGSTVFTKTVSQPNLVHNLKSGIYFLRVQGVDVRGKSGLWSKPFKMVVTAPIKPVENVEAPKQVVFVEKKPEVETSWKAPDSATGFKVKVYKDGEEVLSEQTSDPHVKFKPSGPGDYEIKVSSGFDKYYGPPVTVSTLHVKKVELEAPHWEIPENKRYSNRRPINLEWTPVESAASYRVKVYKVAQKGSRAPASEEPVFQTDKLENNRLVIDPLPPGHYYANVESISDGGTSAVSTQVDIDVKRSKPVEFEKFDITAKYSVTPVYYKASIYENGGDSVASGLGGNGQIEGNLWLPESNWGMRAGGTWGGFTVNGTNITYNDLQAAAQYHLTGTGPGFHTDFRPYLGARAWDVPLVLGSGPGDTPGKLQVLDVNLIGPLAGFEVTKPLSEKWALVGRGQISFPVLNSTVGNGAFANIKADPKVPSAKVEAGVKYALPGTLRLVAMAGYTDDEAKFAAFAGADAQGPPPSNTYDTLSLRYPTLTLGVEASDDGPLFRTSETTTPKPERFSDFDLSARYSYSIVNYTASLIESNNGDPNPSAKNLSGGDINLDGRGWFRDSHHGIRVDAAWSGFNDQGASINFPQFHLQWGYRPKISPTLVGWNFQNFFGIRAWRVPLIEVSGGGSGGPTAGAVTFRAPQLVGPAETVVVSKGFSETWSARFMGDISTPAAIADKDSFIDRVVSDAPSFRAEIQGLKAVSPDLIVGMGVGYFLDEFKYVPTLSSSTGNGYSLVQVSAPIISIFGTYSF